MSKPLHFLHSVRDELYAADHYEELRKKLCLTHLLIMCGQNQPRQLESGHHYKVIQERMSHAVRRDQGLVYGVYRFKELRRGQLYAELAPTNSESNRGWRLTLPSSSRG